MIAPPPAEPTPIVAGIETEYGIAIRGAQSFDPAAASLLLLARCRPAVPARALPQDGVLHDLMLPNGARFYLDHAHPEYSTPECRSPHDVVAADRAGEQILDRCRMLVEQDGILPAGQRLALYKNNSDGAGHSYGCHENYLVSPATWRAVLHGEPGIASYAPFLATRALLCGAGKVGAENGAGASGFQLSQRADFLETLRGTQTTHRRPLLNTRNEPHGRRYRRLHVIAGDANLAEHATWLKVGTTALVLALIEAGRAPSVFRLRDPVAAFRIVSRDLSFRARLELDGGRWATALEVQRAFLAAARSFVAERPAFADYRSIVDAWDGALACLDGDWTRLADRLDWALKRMLLERVLARHGATWDEVQAWQPVIEATADLPRPRELATDDPAARLAPALGRKRAEQVSSAARTLGLSWTDYWRRRELHFALRRVDLDYHEVRYAGPGPALFARLEQADTVQRVVRGSEIAMRTEKPPSDTRAWVRGRLIEMLAPYLVAVDWSAVEIRVPGEPHRLRVELADPLAGRSAQSDQLLARLTGRIQGQCGSVGTDFTGGEP